MTCRQNFKLSLQQVMSLHRKTKEQIEFINNFYKYMPLTYSDSPMNLLCRHVEEINFNISNKLKTENVFNSFDIYKNSSFTYNNDDYHLITNALKSHNNSVSFKLLTKEIRNKHGFNDEDINEFDLDNESLSDILNEINSNVWVVVNCLVDYFYKENPSSNKDVLWNTYGKYIYNNIINNTSDIVKFPFPACDGDINYLGKQFKLMEIKI